MRAAAAAAAPAAAASACVLVTRQYYVGFKRHSCYCAATLLVGASQKYYLMTPTAQGGHGHQLTEIVLPSPVHTPHLQASG